MWASFEALRTVYQMEAGHLGYLLKYAYKLISKTLNPSILKRWNVKIAFKVFNFFTCHTFLAHNFDIERQEKLQTLSMLFVGSGLLWRLNHHQKYSTSVTHSRNQLQRLKTMQGLSFLRSLLTGWMSRLHCVLMMEFNPGDDHCMPCAGHCMNLQNSPDIASKKNLTWSMCFSGKFQRTLLKPSFAIPAACGWPVPHVHTACLWMQNKAVPVNFAASPSIRRSQTSSRNCTAQGDLWWRLWRWCIWLRFGRLVLPNSSSNLCGRVLCTSCHQDTPV